MMVPRGGVRRTHFMVRRFSTCNPSARGAGRNVNMSMSSWPRRRAAPLASSSSGVVEGRPESRDTLQREAEEDPPFDEIGMHLSRLCDREVALVDGAVALRAE